MDPSILQAAQRVTNWHLQHTVMPTPPAPPTDWAGAEEATSAAEAQSDSDGSAAGTALDAPLIAPLCAPDAPLDPAVRRTAASRPLT